MGALLNITVTDEDRCPVCGMGYDWCGWCGYCLCKCDCWESRAWSDLLDRRYQLWNDEGGQGMAHRPIDTVTLAGSLL